MGLVNLGNLLDYRTHKDFHVRFYSDCPHQSNSMERLSSIDFDLNFCSVLFDLVRQALEKADTIYNIKADTNINTQDFVFHQLKFPGFD